MQLIHIIFRNTYIFCINEKIPVSPIIFFLTWRVAYPRYLLRFFFFHLTVWPRKYCPPGYNILNLKTGLQYSLGKCSLVCSPTRLWTDTQAGSSLLHMYVCTVWGLPLGSIPWTGIVGSKVIYFKISFHEDLKQFTFSLAIFDLFYMWEMLPDIFEFAFL